MDFIYKFIEQMANLFDGAGAIIFLVIMLGRKERLKRSGIFYLLCIIFVGLLGFLPFLFENSVAQIVVIMMLELCFSVLVLSRGIGSKLFFSAFYNMILLFTNFFVIYGLVWFLQSNIEMLCKEGTTLRMMALVINKVMLVCILIFAIMIKKRKQFEYQEWLSVLFMYSGILITGSVLTNITKSGHLNVSEEGQLIGIAIGLLAVSIAISICIYKLNQQNYYRTENKILNMRIQGEMDVLSKIEEMYNDNQILRHDLKRYLMVVQGMLSSGETGQAIQYLEKVTENRFEQTQIYFTNSSVVNAVLNDKAETCRKNSICYEAKITGKIPEQGQIEIGMILSNLIDNAIEAEMKEVKEKRKIEIGLSKYKGMYMIRVENYIGKSVLGKNPELKSGKEDGKKHGIGIKSVRKMVGELNGAYLCEETAHTFFTTILLPG